MPYRHDISCLYEAYSLSTFLSFLLFAFLAAFSSLLVGKRPVRADGEGTMPTAERVALYSLHIEVNA